MFSEIEILTISLVGGFIGCLLALTIMKSHYKYTLKHLNDAQYKFYRNVNLIKLQEDVQNLKIQIIALQSQFGVNE
jgi:hypothetical protein